MPAPHLSLIVPTVLHPASAREATTATIREDLRDMQRSLRESKALCFETRERDPFPGFDKVRCMNHGRRRATLRSQLHEPLHLFRRTRV